MDPFRSLTADNGEADGIEYVCVRESVCVLYCEAYFRGVLCHK